MKFGEVEFNYALDPIVYNEPTFYSSSATKYSGIQQEIDDDKSCKIEDAIKKAKLWMDAYTAMYKFFTEQKEKGIKYVNEAVDASTAEKFEFDNLGNPESKTTKSKRR